MSLVCSWWVVKIPEEVRGGGRGREEVLEYEEEDEEAEEEIRNEMAEENKGEREGKFGEGWKGGGGNKY